MDIARASCPPPSRHHWRFGHLRYSDGRHLSTRPPMSCCPLNVPSSRDPVAHFRANSIRPWSAIISGLPDLQSVLSDSLHFVKSSSNLAPFHCTMSPNDATLCRRRGPFVELAHSTYSSFPHSLTRRHETSEFHSRPSGKPGPQAAVIVLSITLYVGKQGSFWGTTDHKSLLSLESTTCYLSLNHDEWAPGRSTT